MRRALCGIVSLLVLCSCSSAYQVPIACRHEAILSAMVMQEQGYEVKIVSGTTPTGRHAQAMMRVDGQDVWLHSDGSWVYSSGQDVFSPDSAYDWMEYALLLYTGSIKRIGLLK